MKNELRTLCHDGDLGLDACQFQGMEQPFPHHFHDYYVLGLMEAGHRRLFCKNVDYIIGPGDILLFQPGDSHGCASSGGEKLDYRSLHIPQETMLALAEEVTGVREPPVFSENVIRDQEMAENLLRLHRMVMEGSREFEKEEVLLLLAARLVERYGRTVSPPVCAGDEVARACAYMEAHFSERVALDQLCRESGLSKSALLRAFTGSRGVTPYRYLQALRIGQAKILLEQGIPPAEAGLRTGFSDQSHFSRFFTQFIGLPPAAYARMYQEDRKWKNV
ncbi:MAG: AraC family transcriptional regulator [Oscillibacter sp.]|nr:AraC family transcriptional regulator [Oscillibacter sp.]